MEDLLELPVYIITLQGDSTRESTVIERIKNAGFTNVTVCYGVDMRQNQKDEWEDYSVNKDDIAFQKSPGKQGKVLSHINVWKRISEAGVSKAIVFEDDALFHSEWHTLASSFWESTPKDFDLLYLGSYNAIANPTQKILSLSVFSTHAYIISQKCASKLYTDITSGALQICSIDYMINRWLSENYTSVKWYVWNAVMYPDTAKKDMFDNGLVFQDLTLRRAS